MSFAAIPRFVAKEVREMIPPTLFFAAGFNLIVATGHLVLPDYGLQLFNFVVATTSALFIGKAVLVANAMPFLTRYDDAPLIVPVLFRTFVYSVATLLVQLLERLVEYWIGGGAFSATLTHLADGIPWNRFVAVHLWITLLFLLYTSINAVGTRLGEGVLWRMFFSRAQVATKTRQGIA